MLTIKFFIFALIAVVSGGALFPKSLKKHRGIVLLVGIVSTIGTTYLFRDIYNDMKSEIKEEVIIPISVPDKLAVVSFPSIIEAMALPKMVEYSVHDWHSILKYMAGVRFPKDKETGKVYVFQSCKNEKKRGKAKFFFGDAAPMTLANDEVVEWVVWACGANVGVEDLTFRSDNTHMHKEIYSGIKNEFTQKGFKFEYLGCFGGFSEGWSYYLLTREQSRPFYMSIYSFAANSNPYVIIKISFEKDKDMDVSFCPSQKVDRLIIAQ